MSAAARALALIAVVGAAGCGDTFDPGTERSRSPRCTLAGAYQLTFTVPPDMFTGADGPQALAFVLPDPMTRFRPARHKSAAFNRAAADAWFASSWRGRLSGPAPALLAVADDPLILAGPDHQACAVTVDVLDHGRGFRLELRVDGNAPGVTGHLAADLLGRFDVTGTRQPLPPGFEL